MNIAKIAEFSAHYETLGEWELFDIDSRRSTLTEEARVALDRALVQRGIDLSTLKTEEAAEQKERANCEQEQRLRAEKRDALYLKIFWIVSLPMVIFGALFRTESFYETLVSALVQGVVIGLLYWGFLKFRRSRNQRRP